jgi:hypothetical protein
MSRRVIPVLTPRERLVPKTAWSFAPNRVREHPDFAIGSYVSEPFLGQYISEPFLGVGAEPEPLPGREPLPPGRGYISVPLYDVTDYIRTLALTAGIGFALGALGGAIGGPAVGTFVRSFLRR